VVSQTVLVGGVDDAGERLARACREALNAAIAVSTPGKCLAGIGRAIHAVADAHGYESVTNYCGHGVGRQFHMAPFVQHFRNSDKFELAPGMVFTIEPMFCERSASCEVLDSDGWTVVTRDGGRAAQYEHTVAITHDGCEVLTKGGAPQEGQWNGYLH